MKGTHIVGAAVILGAVVGGGLYYQYDAKTGAPVVEEIVIPNDPTPSPAPEGNTDEPASVVTEVPSIGDSA